MLIISLLIVALLGGVSGTCSPTSSMVEYAAADGLDLHRLSDPQHPREWLCGDFNWDGREDLCARLATEKHDWIVGCFVSQGTSHRFAQIAYSEDHGLGVIAASGLFVELVSRGTEFNWANAAEVTLLRDCVSFGTLDTAPALYCYDGERFVSIQEVGEADQRK